MVTGSPEIYQELKTAGVGVALSYLNMKPEPEGLSRGYRQKGDAMR